MSRHIQAEVLARYRSGDLGKRRSRRITAHLASCHRCTTASSDLAEVSQLLRATSTLPMPADITARIEAALAAEAAQPSRAKGRASQLAAAGAGRGPGGAQHSGPRSRRKVPASGRSGWPALRSPVALRVLAGTAVAAVIAGGAYTAGQLAGASSTGTASSASAAQPRASRSSDAPMVRTPSAGDLAPESSPGPGPASSAAGSSAAGRSLAGPTLKYLAVHGTATFVPVAAGADFGRQDLASAVGGLLLSAGHKAPLGSPSGARTVRFFSGIPVTTLEGCVSRVAAGGRVRLVDVDRYRGSKATIIVVAPAAGSRQQIWVVGPGCSSSDPQVITRATLPRAG
jgi:hypothetical protein